MRKFLLAAWLYLAAAVPAFAGVTCSLPFNLVNGTTADASQVMANYNALVTCLGSAAAAGVNNDITQLLALTTPITPAQGGSTVFLGGTSTGAANAQVISSTTPSTGFSFTQNYTVIFKAGFTNSAATTLTVSGTAKNLFKQTPTGPTALTGNEIQAGQIVFAFYDGTQWQMLPPLSVSAGFGLTATGSAQVSISSTQPPYGFTVPVNMGLTVSANTPSANLLQVCMVDQTGATPSASSPVLIPFQTGSSPEVLWRAVTSSTCINTNAAGATLGTQNSVPFRLWVVAFDNGGTVVLGLWHSGAGASTPVINPLSEDLSLSSTAISAAATSAGVIYTPNGTTVSSKKLRIIASLEFNSGLATAGSYSVAPITTMFGPGIHKPGDVVQSTFASAVNNLSITPASACNLVKVQAVGIVGATGSSPSIAMTLKRGGSAGTTLQGDLKANNGAANETSMTFPFLVLDNPQTTTSTNYDFSTCSNCTTSTSATRSSILLEEIQG